MNSIYFTLYEELDEEESYTGEAMLKTVQQVIKDTTLRMIAGGAAPTAKKEESASESEGESEADEASEEESQEQEVGMLTI